MSSAADVIDTLRVKVRPNRIFHIQKLRSYDCLQCGVNLEQDRNLKEHIRNVHVKKIKCKFVTTRWRLGE